MKYKTKLKSQPSLAYTLLERPKATLLVPGGHSGDPPLQALFVPKKRA
jgi:hypothetical protein